MDALELFEGEGKRYTEYGLDIDQQVAATIEPLIRAYHKQGCKIRDLEYIFKHAVTDICLSLLLFPDENLEGQ